MLKSRMARGVAALAILGGSIGLGIVASGGSTKAAFSNVSCDPNNEVVVQPGAYSAGGSGMASGVNLSGNVVLWTGWAGPVNVEWTTAAQVTGNAGAPDTPAPGTLKGNLTLTLRPTGAGAPPKAVFTSDCIGYSEVDNTHYLAIYHGWFNNVPGWEYANEEALVAFYFQTGAPTATFADLGIQFYKGTITGDTCWLGPDVQFAMGNAGAHMLLPGSPWNNKDMGRRVTNCDGNWAFKSTNDDSGLLIGGGGAGGR